MDNEGSQSSILGAIISALPNLTFMKVIEFYTINKVVKNAMLSLDQEVS